MTEGEPTSILSAEYRERIRASMASIGAEMRELQETVGRQVAESMRRMRGES